MEQEPALLVTSEVARRLNVNPATVRRWAEEGRIRHIKLPNGFLRFDPADLDTWLAPIEAAKATS